MLIPSLLRSQKRDAKSCRVKDFEHFAIRCPREWLSWLNLVKKSSQCYTPCKLQAHNILNVNTWNNCWLSHQNGSGDGGGDHRHPRTLFPATPLSSINTILFPGQTASSGITMSTPMSISSTNTSPAGGGKQKFISWRLLFAHRPSSFQIVYKFWRAFSNKMRCICRLNPACSKILITAEIIFFYVLSFDNQSSVNKLLYILMVSIWLWVNTFLHVLCIELTFVSLSKEEPASKWAFKKQSHN